MMCHILSVDQSVKHSGSPKKSIKATFWFRNPIKLWDKWTPYCQINCVSKMLARACQLTLETKNKIWLPQINECYKIPLNYVWDKWIPYCRINCVSKLLARALETKNEVKLPHTINTCCPALMMWGISSMSDDHEELLLFGYKEKVSVGWDRMILAHSPLVVW